MLVFGSFKKLKGQPEDWKEMPLSAWYYGLLQGSSVVGA